jgi:hypothetical protein
VSSQGHDEEFDLVSVTIPVDLTLDTVPLVGARSG